MMVAAYIDLNPVRVGIVADPKDYRWCGYAQSLASGGFKNIGLGRIFYLSGYTLGQALDEYRKLLFGVGYKGKHSSAPVINQKEVREVMRQGGRLKKSELLRHRVRYFSDGAILGSKSYVKRIFEDNHKDFTDRKSDRCSQVPIADDDSFSVFRNLRKAPIC